MTLKLIALKQTIVYRKCVVQFFVCFHLLHKSAVLRYLCQVVFIPKSNDIKQILQNKSFHNYHKLIFISIKMLVMTILIV